MKDIPVLIAVSALVFTALLGMGLPPGLLWITVGTILVALAWSAVGWSWFRQFLKDHARGEAGDQWRDRMGHMSTRAVPGAQATHKLLWRSSAVGVALFLLPPTAMRPDPIHVVAAYAVLAIWCYQDGIVSKGRWFPSLGEACGWFLFAAIITGLLLWGLGSASTPDGSDVLQGGAGGR